MFEKIVFESFGYKYGAPYMDGMFVDVRSLPNPYWVEELRPLTGLDEPVAEYIRKSEITKKFMEEFIERLDIYFDLLTKQESAPIIYILIGCTGGQHRSVFVTEEVAKIFKEKFNNKYQVEIVHRELEAKR